MLGEGAEGGVVLDVAARGPPARPAKPGVAAGERPQPLQRPLLQRPRRGRGRRTGRSLSARASARQPGDLGVAGRAGHVLDADVQRVLPAPARRVVRAGLDVVERQRARGAG